MGGIFEGEGADFDLRARFDFDLPDVPDLDLIEMPNIELRDALDIDVLYMAIGASDALGIGATPVTNGYVFRIEDALEDGDTNVHLVNVAIPDGTVETITDAAQLALQVAPKPNVVTIWVGANDIIEGVALEEFEEELDNLLDELDGSGATAAIADIPDLTELPRFRDNTNTNVTDSRIAAFNEVIHDQAEAHGMVLVRLSGEEVEDRLVSDADGFHPNDAGHARIAELFLEAIEPEVAADEVPTLSTADFDLFA
jgi:lysophospholipase L1-like esterase